MFPTDAKSIKVDYSGSGTACPTIFSTSTDPITILWANGNLQTADKNNLFIGTSTYLSSFNNKWVENYSPSVVVNKSVYCSRESNSIGSWNIVYVPYDLTKVSTSTIISTGSSTFPAVASGFTYGEIVNSVWLFLSFVMIAYAFFYFSIAGIKVKK